MTTFLIKAAAVAVTVSAVGLCAGVAVFSRVDFAQLDEAIGKVETATIFSTANRVYARDGSLIDQYADDSQKFVSIDELPPHVPQAFISAEDKDFYAHRGISARGVARAMLRNAAAGDAREGASTITQQLARMFFLNREKTIGRKINEAVLALKLERRFTKKIILEAYLNNVFLGPGAKGLENAARVTFGKHARELGVAEAALLAGLAPAPSRYHPKRDPRAARVRQAYVLKRMVEDGYLARDDAARYAREPLRFGDRSTRTLSHAVFFREAALDEARRVLGRDEIEGLNLAIHTTFDPEAQDRVDAMARAVLRDPLWERATAGGRQVAAVTYDAASGKLLALRGGISYEASQYNRAFRTQRGMGESVLPFLYAVALENGMGLDAPLFGPPPSRARGLLEPPPPTLFDGLAGNLLPESLRLLYVLGAGTVAESARAFAWPTDRALPQVALGLAPTTLLDQAKRFGLFAHQGAAAEPHLVSRIVDAAGNELYRRASSAGRPAFSGETAYIMAWALGKALAARAGMAAEFTGPMFAGFSTDKQDAWLIGGSGSEVTAFWIGQDKGGVLVDDKNPLVPSRLARLWLETWERGGGAGRAGMAPPPYVGFREMSSRTVARLVAPFDIRGLANHGGDGAVKN